MSKRSSSSSSSSSSSFVFSSSAIIVKRTRYSERLLLKKGTSELLLDLPEEFLRNLVCNFLTLLDIFSLSLVCKRLRSNINWGALIKARFGAFFLPSTIKQNNFYQDYYHSLLSAWQPIKCKQGETVLLCSISKTTVAYTSSRGHKYYFLTILRWCPDTRVFRMNWRKKFATDFRIIELSNNGNFLSYQQDSCVGRRLETCVLEIKEGRNVEIKVNFDSLIVIRFEFSSDDNWLLLTHPEWYTGKYTEVNLRSGEISFLPSPINGVIGRILYTSGLTSDRYDKVYVTLNNTENLFKTLVYINSTGYHHIHANGEFYFSGGHRGDILIATQDGSVRSVRLFNLLTKRYEFETRTESLMSESFLTSDGRQIIILNQDEEMDENDKQNNNLQIYYRESGTFYLRVKIPIQFLHCVIYCFNVCQNGHSVLVKTSGNRNKPGLQTQDVQSQVRVWNNEKHSRAPRIV